MALTTEDELQGRADNFDIGVLLRSIPYPVEEHFLTSKSHRLVLK